LSAVSNSTFVDVLFTDITDTSRKIDFLSETLPQKHRLETLTQETLTSIPHTVKHNLTWPTVTPLQFCAYSSKPDSADMIAYFGTRGSFFSKI
jgi:hypothetical protein